MPLKLNKNLINKGSNQNFQVTPSPFKPVLSSSASSKDLPVVRNHSRSVTYSSDFEFKNKTENDQIKKKTKHLYFWIFIALDLLAILVAIIVFYFLFN